MYSPLRASSHFSSLTAAVRKTRSPLTIGDDQPPPDRLTLQATLVFASQVSGRLAFAETPARLPPRKAGQLSSAAKRARSSTVCMGLSWARALYYPLPPRSRFN